MTAKTPAPRMGGHVVVIEDGECAGEQRMAQTVDLGELLRQPGCQAQLRRTHRTLINPD